MENLAVLDFGGKNIRFERRGDRVWVSLTDMAKATGKRVNDYLRLAATVEYLQEFGGSAGIPADQLLETNESKGTNEQRGTWAIEEIAIDFAAWCNVKFRVWVTQQIKTLMTEGTVSIARKSSILDRPDPWQRFYDKDFCDRAFAWFGAQFYWEFVYSELTPEEACKVNLLNPPINGVRADKIHQYLTPEAKTRLTPYIRELVAGLDFSPSRQDFLIGYGRRFGGNDQLTLPGM